MTHSDDRGLVLPPRLAPIQVAIVPIFAKGKSEEAVRTKGLELERALRAAGISAVFDARDHKPGYKFHEWEQKGVPLRLELGPRDLEAGQVMLKDRIAEEKRPLPMSGLEAQIPDLLDAFQETLLDRARKRLEEQTIRVDAYDDFREVFAGEASRFVLAHWDGTAETEVRIKEETRATIRVVPFDAEPEEGRCVLTGRPSPRRVLFAKAY